MRLLIQYILWAYATTCLSVLVLGQDIHCSKDEECYNKACCNVPEGETQGMCSYEPDHCSKEKGCVSNCDAKAECGRNAKEPGQECPLNVCCSKWGFCGTAPDFCDADDGCQSNCYSVPPQPSCGGGSNMFNRRIAYYESWSATRECDAWPPERIPAEVLTHVFYSFALINENHEITLGGTDSGTGDLMTRTVALKVKNPSLQIYIAIGGWAFNDPPTQKHFSNTASTKANREKFCMSVLDFMRDYGFDGADLDWEYPVAEERGGEPEDTNNFVLLISECRKIFDGSGKQYGLTFTIPSSYWYLKHFRIQSLLDAGANWANLMSYDLHGVWDKESRWIGNKMGAHTNLTEIKISLDLLWRNDINPEDVVLGFGFYGRSFLIQDEGCTAPGCEFVEGASPGACTNASGILSYAEIMALQDNDMGVEVHYVEEDAINYMVWDTNQWVSYDDARTFKQKIDFAKEKCLGGLMIWAIDQDTYDHRALEGLLGGNIAGGLMNGGELTEDEKNELANDFNRFTGEDCYVSDCVSKGATCKPGYNVLEFVHHPVGKLAANAKECGEDDWRLICCPSKAMPTDCEWQGVHERYGLCDNGNNCDSEHFSLMRDNYNSKEGGTPCLPGKRDLCCQADLRRLPKCRWNTCGEDGCDSDETFMTQSGYGPENRICNARRWHRSNLCCGGAAAEYKNCEWVEGKDGCSTDPTCPKGKVMVAEKPNAWDGSDFFKCLNGKYVKYCCEVPYDNHAKWPVHPDRLFDNPQLDDVSWDYDEHYDSNSYDVDHSYAPGDDAFGLVLLDGDEDSFQGEFDSAWVFLETEDETWNLKKRGWADKRTLKHRNDTFENEIEHFRVFCPHGMESELCKAIFIGRATDTIIKMPPGIGAGPYSRIVQFDVSRNQTLTKRALRRKRQASEEQREDVIFDLVVDYNFAAINAEDKGPVQFRVDFSNLVEYWDEITASPPEKLKLRKKWFGKFKQWLSKVTDIEREDSGSLDLRLTRTWNLFHFQDECKRENSITKVHADLDLSMDMGLHARYAYYFHGHLLPTPKTEEAFGYFSVQPVGNCVLKLSGEGSFQSTSGEKAIITGLAFPGLSVKGLIRIGPQLDLFGQIDTYLRMSGSVEFGVVVSFDPVEMYFPQDADGKAESKHPQRLKNNKLHNSMVSPTFNAKAEAEGQLSFSLTPMASFGIEVLGGKLMKGDLSMGLKNTLTLGVEAKGWTGTDGTGAEVCVWADYDYDFFVRGTMSVLQGTYDWGGDYSLASNDEPIVVKERTCAAFGDGGESDSQTSRVNAFLANSEAFDTAAKKDSLFPVSFGCELHENDPSVEASPCWGPDPQIPDDSLLKRAPTAPVCYKRPSVFYNCAWFSKYTFTITAKGKTEQATFPGICDTISQGIMLGATKPGWSVAQWKARLHYKYDGDNSNRDAACGTRVGSSTDQCKNKNREYWKNADALVKDLDYNLGEETYSSCDEFPFNASVEGGSGATVKCVPQYQQDMQGTIMAMLYYFTETVTDHTTGATSQVKWKDVTGPTYPGYDVHLWYNQGSTAEAGPFGFSEVSPLDATYIVGGYNLWGNPDISGASTGNNAVCMVRATFEKNKKGFGSLRVTGCKVAFTKKKKRRGLDLNGSDPMDDPNNWGMKVVSVDEEPLTIGAIDQSMVAMAEQMAETDARFHNGMEL